MKIHPSRPRATRHPISGKPIIPIGRRKNGRLIWPVMGGSEDAGGDAEAAAAAAAASDAAAAAAAAAEEKSGEDDGKGFPANTPVADMTVDQQAAYWKHQAKRHEGRNNAWTQLGKDPDEVRALIDAAKPDSEKALEAARGEGRAAALQEANATIVSTVVDTLLPDGKKAKDFPILEALDLTKFTNDDGSIDTAKVRTIVKSALGVDGATPPGDTGQGKRGGNGKQSARDAGKAEAERRFKK